MNDKLKKLYDLYTSSGLIQNATFEDFASANEEQRKKLYNLGKSRGLFQTTEFNTFDSAFAIEPIEETPPVKKKTLRNLFRTIILRLCHGWQRLDINLHLLKKRI
jgi:hypothetical protein